MKYHVGCVIVGYGAAALREADALVSFGFKNVVLVTERKAWGTSRNAGSDKQTYYKIALGGGHPDSVWDMADVFFQGKAVDGPHALVEASLSAESFLHLVELGVPFPRNVWGEYAGYQTDHDASNRATSAGPYTSRMMVEALERKLGDVVPVYEHEQLCRILKKGNACMGVACWNTQTHSFDRFFAPFVVLATGGPASMYRYSVYPESQHGATGVAFEAGAEGRNLTEWQQGLASLKPRWNVSGTYMQAIPRFVSTDQQGSDEQEFLDAVDPSLVFLKGYQWPFDVGKVMCGSSIIDLLVQQESLKGRRVFLDYTRNPRNLDFTKLSPEAHEYLSANHALTADPITRLRLMNEPAITFYQEHGVDLSREKLEIALCVQHSNGGILVDGNWQSTIPGLFVVGEAACTHGVRRPGGSALNAGQVGALRSARCIASLSPAPCPSEVDINDLEAMVARAVGGGNTAEALLAEVTTQMSMVSGAVREKTKMLGLYRRVEDILAHWDIMVRIRDEREVETLFRLRDVLFSARSCLFAMIDYLSSKRGSRGGALYTDPQGAKPMDGMPEEFRFSLWDDAGENETQCIRTEADGTLCSYWRKVYGIPHVDIPFEEVWKEFRAGKSV